MSFESIITHMNEEHTSSLEDLCKKFGDEKEIKDVKLLRVDLEGLVISCNGKDLRVNFPEKATEDTIKEAVISLCKNAKAKSFDFDKIKNEIQEFALGFNSICLATLTKDNQVNCTYAPFVRTQWGDYIYISEVAEHYKNIVDNPNNVEIMFLEDECKASSAILRKRLRYRVKPTIVERDATFDKVYDEFERKTDNEAVKFIRNMLDFHLVKLELLSGGYVKGFGQAFAIDGNGELTHVTSKQTGTPHKYSK